LLSLYDFRLKRLYEAENGQSGMGGQCDGRKGQDLELALPVGTLVFARGFAGEELLADVSAPEARIVVARGGRGGKGNEHFKSAVMRAPRFAQPGEPGEELSLRLELKILADAGIIGLPNAGKSTLISKVSAARPKIGVYPFTTLTPNLGVMIDEADPERRLILADIPGLIEGAHQGLGLGHRFLKHVERTRFLIHMLSFEDVNMADPFAGFALINEELALFEPALAGRAQLQVINKTDLAAPEQIEAVRRAATSEGREFFFISARQGRGLEKLVAAMWRLRDTLDASEPFPRCKEMEGNDDREGDS
jgi:GTP-binding protein